MMCHDCPKLIGIKSPRRFCCTSAEARAAEQAAKEAAAQQDRGTCTILNRGQGAPVIANRAQRRRLARQQRRGRP